MELTNPDIIMSRGSETKTELSTVDAVELARAYQLKTGGVSFRNSSEQTAYILHQTNKIDHNWTNRHRTPYLAIGKQARKSSEDAQAVGYAQFEKVWAG